MTEKNKPQFIPINEMFQKFNSRELNTWVDKVTFLNILSVWVGSVTLFGIGYYFLRTSSSYLLYSYTHLPVDNLIDSIYFSFVTATSTGFGDIVPLGFYKILAIFEVTFGLLLLAFVTSKLISLKQNVIMGEIYELSLQERIHALRSSLILFRQHLSQLIEKTETSKLKKSDASDLYNSLSSLEETLYRISLLLLKRGHTFTKSFPPQDLELILRSVVQSFEKMMDTTQILTKYSFDWKHEFVVQVTKRCLKFDRELFDEKNLHLLSNKARVDLKEKNEVITKLLWEEINKSSKKEKNHPVATK